MNYAIKTTAELKQYNADLFQRFALNEIAQLYSVNGIMVKNGIPNLFARPSTGKLNDNYNHDRNSEWWAEDGFMQIIKEPLGANQKQGDGFIDDDVWRIPAIPMTPEEIAAKDAEIAAAPLNEEYARYQQRIRDGQDAYAKASAEIRMSKLQGDIDQTIHELIENTLEPVRNELYMGQWITARKKLEAIGPTIIGQSLYNDYHTRLTDYIDQSYV